MPKGAVAILAGLVSLWMILVRRGRAASPQRGSEQLAPLDSPLRQPGSQAGAGDSPRPLLLNVALQERQHQTAALAGLNTVTAALLGFEAVLAVNGIKVAEGPNFKGAALSALALSMIFLLVALSDCVVHTKHLRREPPKVWQKMFPRRIFSISPKGLKRHLEKPVPQCEKLIFNTVGHVYQYATDYVINPKKRCLAVAVPLLVVALVIGGVGVSRST